MGPPQPLERGFIVITIIEEHRGLRMKFIAPGTGWRGFSVVACNLAECNTAIMHHYGKPHDESICPLCRRREEMEAKDERRP